MSSVVRPGSSNRLVDSDQRRRGRGVARRELVLSIQQRALGVEHLQEVGEASLEPLLPRYFACLAVPARIASLQKRHVGRYARGHWIACGTRFIEADHPSTWLSDQRAFLDDVLSASRNMPHATRHCLPNWAFTPI